MKMVKNEIHEFDFCKLDSTNCSDTISELNLQVAEKKHALGVFAVSDKYEPKAFVWMQDIEGLKTLIELTDSLITSNTPCHQYLAYEEEGMIIKLSYKEYD